MAKKRPATADAFRKRWPAFRRWLEAAGSEVKAPTNGYELARFTTPQGVGVVYCDRAQRVSSWMNGAGEAFDAYLSGRPWSVSKKPRASRGARKRAGLVATLIERDGAGCAFCGEPLTTRTATIEHIVPMAGGGTDHLNNMTLACKPCNQGLGHLSARQKIEYAVRQRAGAEAAHA